MCYRPSNRLAVQWRSGSGEGQVSLAHGYARVTGRPLAVAVHANVGLMHAAMAIFNAWCDRVPVYLVLGNAHDACAGRKAVLASHPLLKIL